MKLVESAPVSTPTVKVPMKDRPSWRRIIGKVMGHGIATVLGLAFLVGLGVLGHATGWQVPKFSTLLGASGPEKDDWCAEHNVPESICVECQKAGKASKDLNWCRIHGVHDCPLCQPNMAQTMMPAVVTDDDRQRAERALRFSPRTENNSKCALHQRVIQFANTDVVERLGIEVAPARLEPVSETFSTSGEITFDPRRVARLSAKVTGNIWWVAKNIGDRVTRGDVLAIIDAADVGRSKAEFQQALVQLDLKRQVLANLNSATGAVAGKQLQEAEAAIEESRVRLLQAEQALANLGMPIRADAVKDLEPPDVAKRLQFLGLPAPLVPQLAGRSSSNNLLAIVAPFDGEVIARSAVAGELAEPTKMLFTVADTSQMLLTLKVRLEDAGRIAIGSKVRFQHGAHAGTDDGRVAWISPTADEKSRTIAVRVEMPNRSGQHHSNTFGIAKVILREEPQAVVVPSTAIHWEGDCNVVFVRDKDFEKPDGLKVFHVRKVRPGAQDVAAIGPVTEVAAGLLPGEMVATANSGILRTELLKNNLGAG